MTDGIIFDVDGTLWDSTPVVEEAWNQALIDIGINDVKVTADRLKGLFGLPMDEIIADILPMYSEEIRKKYKPVCYEYEDRYLRNQAGVVYPQMEEMLKILSSRYKLFIVSNCQAGYVELLYDKTGFEKYFVDHLCPGDTGLLKADNIRLIVEKYGLQNPVYVGDTQMDANACRLAGVPIVFAAYGFGSVVNPDYVIQCPMDLTSIFIK